MAGLDLDSARLAIVQFSLHNWNIIPPFLLNTKRGIETLFEQQERKERHTGVALFDPVENVSIVKFLRDNLQGSGFELVNEFCQPRLDLKDGAGKRTYPMVRFEFVPGKYVTNLNEEFMAKRELLLGGLYTMVTEAAWRVRAYENKFYGNGQVVPGEKALSINLDVRVPLFEDGRPRLVWKKGPNGERIGDAPVPLKPAFSFCVGENHFQPFE